MTEPRMCERPACENEGTGMCGLDWVCEPCAQYLVQHGVYCCIEPGSGDWPDPACPGFAATVAALAPRVVQIRIPRD